MRITRNTKRREALGVAWIAPATKLAITALGDKCKRACDIKHLFNKEARIACKAECERQATTQYYAGVQPTAQAGTGIWLGLGLAGLAIGTIYYMNR